MKKAIGLWVAACVAAGCQNGGGGMNQPLTCPDSFEPNDDSAGAKRITPGMALSGLKACAGDEDWFVVSLAAGEVLNVNLDAKQGKVDRPGDAVQVLVHEGTQMAAIMRAPTSSDGYAVRAELQPGEAGDYYIHVKALPGDGVVEYDLAALVSPATQNCPAGEHPQSGVCVKDGCSDLGFEKNEDIASAKVLLAGTYKGLKICDATDRDFFVMAPPPGGGAFTVTMNLTGGAGDIDMWATDGSMKAGGAFKVMGAAASSAGRDFLTRVPVADGQQVYVMIAGDKMATNTYDLEVTWDPLDEKRDCTMDCGALIPMPGPVDPSLPESITAGYFVGTDPEYAYARRDLAMLLVYAFDAVAKKFPDTKPLYLSDICQADGKTPGVDVGQPRHPTTTHVNGRDVDVAYYSTLADNDYRIICGDGTDMNGNGRKGKYNDGYFCTTDQNVVDWPRETYFVAQLMGSPLFRVLGVDETLPQQFVDQAYKLQGEGAIATWAVDRIESGLGYGNDGGWAFHHHHIHLSLMDR